MIKAFFMDIFYKALILAIILSLLPLVGLGDASAQVPNLNHEVMIDLLSQSSKLSDPERILQDFLEDKTTTRIIVDYVKPPSASLSHNFQDISNRGQLEELVNDTRDSIVTSLDPAEIQITNTYHYIFAFSAEVTLQGLYELTNRSDIISIQKDEILHATTTQGIALMNALDARTHYNGAGMSIAICDTGIDYTHPQLGGGAFPNSKVIGGSDCGDDDADPMDCNGHGTSCAGIAAGDLGTVGDYIGGVAYNARLYAVKISGACTDSASFSDMVQGWDWCVAHQYNDPSNPIMVISTSFGGDYFTSLCDSAVPSMTTAAANAVAAGMTLFVSSGNDGYCDGMGWPACISHVNSVGAVYDANIGRHPPAGYVGCIESDSCYPWSGGNPGDPCFPKVWFVDSTTTADQVTTYSNSANFLNLFAPSNNAYTTDISGSGGYSSGDYYPGFGGTSAACPYTAGAAACLQNAAMEILGRYLTPAEVRSYLTDNGDLVTDTKVAVTQPRVNLGRAINAIPRPDLVVVPSMDKPTYQEGEQATLNVECRDQSDTPVDGATVTYLVKDSSHVTLRSGSCSDLGGGQYSTTFPSPELPGSYTVEVTAQKDGYEDGFGSTSFSVIENIVGISLTITPPEVEVGSGNYFTLTATITDSNGNPTEGEEVNFIILNGDVDWLDLTTQITNGAGQAVCRGEPITSEPSIDITFKAVASNGLWDTAIGTAVNTCNSYNIVPNITDYQIVDTYTIYTVKVAVTAGGDVADYVDVSLAIDYGYIRELGTSTWYETETLTTDGNGFAWAEVKRESTSIAQLSVCISGCCESLPIPGHIGDLSEIPTGKSLPGRHILAGRNSLSWSPAGNKLAAIWPFDAVTIWRTSDWSSVPYQEDPGWEIPGISFSPDGSQLAVLHTAGIPPNYNQEHVCIVNADTGAEIGCFATEGQYWSIDWSPTAQLIATVGSDTVKIWDNGGHLVQPLSFSEQVMSISFSPGGTYLAVGLFGVSEAIIYRTSDWSYVSSCNFPPSECGNCDAFSFGWKPDESQIAIAWDMERVTIHTVSTGAEIAPGIPHNQYVSSLDWSNNGQYIASNGDPGGRLFELSSGNWVPLATLQGSIYANAFKFHPDNCLLAVGVDATTTNIYAPFDFIPPTVGIDQPPLSSNVPYTQTSVIVQGNINDNCGLATTGYSRNGVPLDTVPLDTNNDFSLEVSGLVVGPNEITITATDFRGLQNQDSVTVVRLDDVDIYVNSITTNPAPPDLHACDQATIAVNVANNSAGNPTGIQICIDISGPGSYHYTSCKTDQPLGDIDFPWDTTGLLSGNYDITATVFHPIDSNPANDSLLETVHVNPPSQLAVSAETDKPEYQQPDFMQPESITLNVSIEGDLADPISGAWVTYVVKDNSEEELLSGAATDNGNGDYSASFNSDWQPVSGGQYTIEITTSKICFTDGEISIPLSVKVPPLVATNSATDITTAAATLNGNLLQMATAAQVNVSFQWATDDYYTSYSGNYSQETIPQLMTTANPFSVNLTSLDPDNTYHYRVKAVGDGTDYGSDITFTTIVDEPEVSVTMAATAEGEGVNSDLEFGICDGATDLFDVGIDTLHPPSGPGQTFDAYFLTADPIFPQLNGDYRAPLDEITDTRIWTLYVKSGSADISLFWNASLIPGDLYAYTDTGTEVIDMKAQDSLLLPAGQYTLIISISSQPHYVEFALNLKAGWNMVSVPVTPTDNSTSAVFPGVAAVFTWNAVNKSYYVPTTIESCKAYWVAVVVDTTITVCGVPVETCTIGIKAGWNMIGSITTNTSIADPNDDPDGSVILPANWWDPVAKAYTTTTDIEPVKGYWAASVQYCTLTIP